MTRHLGRCHCGALRVTFHTDKPLQPRACQCGFCRRHGARTVSDPDGEVAFARDGSPLVYRFASGVTDYLICPTCGVYLGARAEIGGAVYATLNLNTFEEEGVQALTARPVSYDGESAAARAERRRLNWTPVLARTNFP